MAQTTPGKKFTLEISEDSGTTWLLVGGVQDLTYSTTNPETDVTSQSTTGEFQEHTFNGFTSAQISGSGVSDSRVSATLTAYQKLYSKAYTGDRTVLARIQDDAAAPTLSFEGLFIITSLNTSAPIQGQVNFDFSMQSAEDVTATINVPT